MIDSHLNSEPEQTLSPLSKAVSQNPLSDFCQSILSEHQVEKQGVDHPKFKSYCG